MKRIFMLATVVAGLVLLSSPVLAAEFKAGERISVSAEETIGDDMYVSAGDVDISGTVNGDLIVAGGQVRMNGTVNGDVIAAGGQVTINGAVTDDVRAAGGEVTVSGRIGDDLIVAGGDVEVGRDGQVAGSVRAFAGQLTIAGTTGGIDASVGELQVASTAKVNGDISYQSDTEASIPDGTVTGHVTRKAIDKPDYAQFKLQGTLFSALITALMAYLFLWLLPNKSAKLAADMRTSMGPSFLWGLLFLIIAPVAAMLLFITVIGFPLALGIVLLYPVMIYLGKLVAVIGVGTWLERLWKNKEITQPTVLGIVLGTLAFVLVGLVPFIGWAVVFIAFLIGLGALLRYDWNLFDRLRSDKQL